MRLQSEKQVTVGDKVIGGPVPLICLPLVAKERGALIKQAETVRQFSPDLLEWRVDAYDQAEDPASCLETMQAIKELAGRIPVLLTCRIHAEGGFKKIPQARRLLTIATVIRSGEVDLVDIELCNEPGFIDSVNEVARTCGTRLILSYHNFVETPEENVLLGKLAEAAAHGADIAKVAVMPNNYGDVLTLLRATYRARSGIVKIPLVTMAMGGEGEVTRIAGGLFGSDITFAIGEESSAPGQIPIADLRQAMAVLYPAR